MTTSKQPWTLDGNNIRDTFGNLIGVFVDPRDTQLVVEVWQKASDRVDDLEGRLRDIKEAIEGLSSHV